jgi:hypothetical protein
MQGARASVVVMLSRRDSTSALTASRLVSALAWLRVNSCSACVAPRGRDASAHRRRRARHGPRHAEGRNAARLLQRVLQHHVGAQPQAHGARVLQHRLRRRSGALSGRKPRMQRATADLGKDVVRELKLNVRRLRAGLQGAAGRSAAARGRRGAEATRLLGQQQRDGVQRFLQLRQLLLQPHALLQQSRLRRTRASAPAATQRAPRGDAPRASGSACARPAAS